MKQAIALLLAVYMLLAVLAGCTAKTTTDAEPAPSTTEQETSSETQTPAEAEQAGPVELGLMLWEASEAETEPIDRGIKNYEEASGNKVTKSTVAWSEYHGKLRTLMAADNAPDVFWLNPEYQIDFILDGQICDLTELVNTAYNWDDFIPASQQKMMYTDANGESHIYGVDVCDVGTMFFYNVDMFEEAGYAQEDMPLTKEDMWTWDEFIQIMQDVTQYDEQGNVTVYGTTNFEEPMSLYSTLEMLTSAGANWFNDDFTEAVGMTSDPTIEVLSKIKSLRTEYGVAPDPNVIGVSTNLSAIQQFANKQVASIYIGSYSLCELATYEGINYDVCLPPQITDNYNYSPICSANLYYIWAHTKHYNEAAEFLQFLTSDDFGVALYKSGLWMPNKLSAYDGPVEEYMAGDIYPEHWKDLLWRFTTADCRWFDHMVNTEQVYDVTQYYLEDYFYNDADLMDSMTNMQNEVNALMNEGYNG